MMIFVILIVFFLLLNIWSLYIANKHYKEKEILTGTKYVFLSIACFIVFFFFCLEINFNFPKYLEFFIAAYAFTKIFYLAVLYLINIGRVEKKKKYFSSSMLKYGIFALALTLYFLTKTLFEPRFYVFADALYIPLLGATIIQWLEINDKKVKELLKNFLKTA